jgi:hypothetical protein
VKSTELLACTAGIVRREGLLGSSSNAHVYCHAGMSRVVRCTSEHLAMDASTALIIGEDASILTSSGCCCNMYYYGLTSAPQHAVAGLPALQLTLVCKWHVFAVVCAGWGCSVVWRQHQWCAQTPSVDLNYPTIRDSVCLLAYMPSHTALVCTHVHSMLWQQQRQQLVGVLILSAGVVRAMLDYACVATCLCRR